MYKKIYPNDNSYDNSIIDYVNNSNLTYQEKKNLLEALDFKVN